MKAEPKLQAGVCLAEITASPIGSECAQFLDVFLMYYWAIPFAAACFFRLSTIIKSELGEGRVG